MAILSKLLGDPNQKELRRYEERVELVTRFEPEIQKLTDAKLKSKTSEFRKRLSEGESLDDLLPEAFAVVREAARRVLGERHFDVQLMGGMALHEGKIAEMKTGEGKTLVATLAVYLNALPEAGVHVVTVNDYLAKRDAGWMAPVYSFLGLSVGVIVHDQGLLYDADYIKEDELDLRSKHMRPVTRKEAYDTDITYGTNNEFGFDYLRDNMAVALEGMVQRGHAYAIVDEVDSILIDEARTPLIISQPAEESTEKYYRFAGITPHLKKDTHYQIDEKLKAVTLTDDGVLEVERLLGQKNIYESGGVETIHHLEQALRAQVLFQRDRDYVVKDGEVIIVDEFTGRLMLGRRYSEGLHQAIEAKEAVEIKRESVTLATITFQNYFRLYEKLAGMTGTAATEAEEFHKIYKLDVSTIPTHRPMVRHDRHDVVYKNEKAKFEAVVRDIADCHAKGQPVLVGTISIDKSERLSKLLTKAKVKHNVLNAKYHDRESAIIADAGQKGAVVVATNMAGRGTDIKLAPEVSKLGGLHIIGTERHESRRIDNQLRGRSGRQGDPGSSQFYVSLEDDLMRIFGSERVAGIMDRLGLPDDVPIEHSMISRSIESAQKKVEGHNFDIRKHVVEYDDIMNRHREVIYERRYHALSQEDLSGDILDAMGVELERTIMSRTGELDKSQWDWDELYQAINQVLPIEDKNEAEKSWKQFGTATELISQLQKTAEERYLAKRKGWGDQAILVERTILLRTIDLLWVEHLEAMEHLREGIGLRGYGQRDPLVEYKQEAYNFFQALLGAIDEQVARLIFHVELRTESTGTQEAPASRSEKPKESSPTEAKSPEKKKLGRNDPCWCGSGKKYKKCHGR
jgi:preprotein translocase subunit SecA